MIDLVIHFYTIFSGWRETINLDKYISFVPDNKFDKIKDETVLI